MADLIQVLAQGKRSVFAGKNGKPPTVVHECQCAVLGEELKVGVWRIYERQAAGILTEGMAPALDEKGQKVLDEQGQPKMEKAQVIAPGSYELEYGLGVGWDDKEFGGVLKSVRRVPGAGNSALAGLGAARPVAAREPAKEMTK